MKINGYEVSVTQRNRFVWEIQIVTPDLVKFGAIIPCVNMNEGIAYAAFQKYPQLFFIDIEVLAVSIEPILLEFVNPA